MSSVPENIGASSEAWAEAQADAGSLFAEAVRIMARLRGPEGCPWDREQSFESIRKHTLEEAYEVIDAIDQRDWANLKEELGDLLLQVLFYSQMAAEPGYFTIADVVDGLNRKLVRRHPHVFGQEASVQAGNAVPPGMQTEGIDAGQVLRNWEQIKGAEKSASRKVAGTSRLDLVPRALPALMEAGKLGAKAAKSGFDWPDADGVFAKFDEEIGELRAEIVQQKTDTNSGSNLKTGGYDCDLVAGEVGDLLFTAVNLARHLGVDPELALRETNGKFRRRFAAMEQATTVPLEQHPSSKLEALWENAKLLEAAALEDERR